MRSPLVLMLVVLLGSACVGPAERARLDEEQVDALEPTFATLPRSSSPAGTASGQPTPEIPSTTPEPEGSNADDPDQNTLSAPSAPLTATEGSTRSAAPGGSATLSDPAGDVTGLSSPDWADLRSAELVRDGSTFTLTHTAHEAFPQRGDGTDTMNIATFFDVDGDGTIDYEIWVNLSPDGWGTSYFDEQNGTARYAADDDVAVEVIDGTVRLTFPASHLRSAPTFRWAIASEHGPYQAIGTDAMARDYLPDDRTGRSFPW